MVPGNLIQSFYRAEQVAYEHGVSVMSEFNERYLVDENGTRLGVLLDVKDYQRLLSDIEELESIRAYDAAKASGETPVPFNVAVNEIEQNRP